MEEKHFQAGYCLELAYALKQKNINFEIALIGANYWDKDFDETCFEASHAVIVNPKNKNFFFDSKGERKLSEITYGFDNEITSDIYIKHNVEIEEAESFLGQCEEEAIKEAEKYINENIHLFEKIIPDTIEKQLHDYVDLNVKPNYGELKLVLKECVSIELVNTQNIDAIIQKIDQSKLDCYKYHHNIKNHSKRYSEKSNDANVKEIKEDDYYFSLEHVISFEYITDGIQKIASYNDTLKYAKSFLKSYKHLITTNIKNPDGVEFSIIDKESMKLFNTIKLKELDRKIIEQKLRKVASYKNADDLNNALKQIIKQFANTIEQTTKELEASEDMEVILIKDGRIYAKPISFEGSKEFGSPEWCISSSENYYEEYLDKVNKEHYADTDIYPEDSLTTQSIIEGSHIFCWDFNKEEEDNLRQFAFTISAGSDVIAAHDKEDEDILEDISSLIEKEDLLNLRKKVVIYNDDEKENYLSKLRYEENILESPDLLLTTIKHPLNLFRKIMEGNEDKIMSKASIILIEQELLLESLKRFQEVNDNEISHSQMISDCFYFDNYISKFVSYADNNVEHKEYDEEYDEDHEYYNEDDEENSNKCNYSVGEIYTNTIFGELFENISEIEKQIIYKTEKENILSLLNSEMCSLDLLQGSNVIEGHYRNMQSLKSTILTQFSENMLREKDLKESSKKHLTINHVLKSKEPKEEIFKDFLDIIKNEKMHINKVLFNIEELSDNFKEQIVNVINDTPDLIEYICQDTLYKISQDNIILDNLNNSSCLMINKAIKSKHDFEIMTPQLFGDTSKVVFDFPQRYKKLFDLNIIDKEILDRSLNTSRISHGHLNNTMDSNGKKMDIKDYICQNEKPKQTRKIKIR